VNHETVARDRSAMAPSGRHLQRTMLEGIVSSTSVTTNGGIAVVVAQSLSTVEQT